MPNSHSLDYGKIGPNLTAPFTDMPACVPDETSTLASSPAYESDLSGSSSTQPDSDSDPDSEELYVDASTNQPGPEEDRFVDAVLYQPGDPRQQHVDLGSQVYSTLIDKSQRRGSFSECGSSVAERPCRGASTPVPSSPTPNVIEVTAGESTGTKELTDVELQANTASMDQITRTATGQSYTNDRPGQPFEALPWDVDKPWTERSEKERSRWSGSKQPSSIVSRVSSFLGSVAHSVYKRAEVAWTSDANVLNRLSSSSFGLSRVKNRFSTGPSKSLVSRFNDWRGRSYGALRGKGREDNDLEAQSSTHYTPHPH